MCGSNREVAFPDVPEMALEGRGVGIGKGLVCNCLGKFLCSAGLKHTQISRRANAQVVVVCGMCKLNMVELMFVGCWIIRGKDFAELLIFPYMRRLASELGI